ncbi:APC family permease [Nocardia sp. NBC_01327]|uniref:APC family permease n=1 Tax=Nocardia sp. NBC_01327 TaxID=2903593 RepID=UPI002E1630C6|nr:APC family permease [Nocardia sp. NBC_01327]
MNPRGSALDQAIADPPPVTGVRDTSPMSGLRRRSLGFPGLLAQSVSAIAPCAAAATIPAMLVTASGDGALWAAVLGAGLTLPVAAAINQFTKRVATAGSLYTFTAKGLGATAAFLCGVGMILGYAFIAMYSLANIGLQLSNLLAALGFGTGVLVPVLCVLGCGTACAVVMLRGVRVSARLSLLVESVAVAVLVGLVVVLFLGQGRRPIARDLLAPQHLSFAGLVTGVVIAITAFVGFESAASLSVEARRPFAAVPRVLIWSPIATGILVVAATSVQTTGFRAAGVALDQDSAPVHALSSFYGVGWISPILDCGVAASFFACALASATALVRVLLSMGIDGVLPEAMSRTHPRFRTPHLAIGVSMPIVTAVPLVLLAVGVTSKTAVGILLVVSAGGYVLAYTLVCLAVPFFLRRIGEFTLGPAVVALTAALGLAGCLLVFLGAEWRGPRSAGVWLFLLGVLLGLAAFRRTRQRGALLVGTHDTPIGTEVLGGAANAPGDREPQ